MVLMIDNYDSFTYNLVQYLGELHAEVLVFRNDKITLDGIRKLKPTHIVISPGPGRPDEAGISLAVIREFAGKVPILGVCLGHQCIGQSFGGKIVQAKKLMHGKTSQIYHDKAGIFAGIKNPFCATRYHSLVVEKKSFPQELKVIARTSDNEVMGLKHRKLSVWGVQFHPESIMTESGKKLLENFLKI
jgi:anthranilate synthase/aminodeoxychorismate synthase-like glutamine amidotransferase